MRWVLRITGAQTDKEEGVQRLRLTADKGHYLAPFARLLLAVAALRDKDPQTARTLLASLAVEFPGNQLYAKELARIQQPAPHRHCNALSGKLYQQHDASFVELPPGCRSSSLNLRCTPALQGSIAPSGDLLGQLASLLVEELA